MKEQIEKDNDMESGLNLNPVLEEIDAAWPDMPEIVRAVFCKFSESV